MRIMWHIVMAVMLLAGRSSRAEGLLVFAAASLSDALVEIAAHEPGAGDRVAFNFGASSDLARQVRAGAPADAVIFADDIQMDRLESAGLLRPGTRRVVLGNSLAVIVPARGDVSVSAAADLVNVERLALADPAGVPAGVYARGYLEKIGLWPPLEDRVVPCDNVRAARSAVEAGNADAGIVYLTDVRGDEKVRLAYIVPDAEAPPIRYPAAVTREAGRPDEALRFIERLASPEALAVFRKHGFKVPGEPQP
jgi:molybdate transport system substrate-binding protein